MQNPFSQKSRLAETLLILAVSGWILFQGAMVFFEIRAFWLDEWFVIANLKMHSAGELWGPLDHHQQFPRLYLQALKWVARAGNYSYTSLRILPFMVYLVSLPLVWKMARWVFPDSRWKVWASFLLFLSYPTGLHYSVQVKAYTMEMLAGPVALAQYRFWHGYLKDQPFRPLKMTGALMATVLFPFLSYSYPMVLAPLLFHLGWQSLQPHSKRWPLLVHLFSLLGAWWLDIRQVLADSTMQDYWADKLFHAAEPDSWRRLVPNLFDFLRVAGNGYAVQVLLGLLLLAGLYRKFSSGNRSGFWLLKSPQPDPPGFLIQGLGVAVALFLAGKYPLGESRLNCVWAFSFASLTVYGTGLTEKIRHGGRVLTSLLCLIGILNFGLAAADKGGQKDADTYDLESYRNTRTALEMAYRENLPVLCLPDLASRHFEKAHPETDWIVRTHPSYRMEKPLVLLALPDSLLWKDKLKAQNMHSAIWLSARSVKKVSLP